MLKLTKPEHMRETLSDLSKDELSALFQSLQDSDDCELGRVARKMLHAAVTNYHSERADDYSAASAVDAEIDRRLAVNG